MAYNYGGYERQKGDIDYQYSRDSINNAYGRFISQQRGQRGLGDMQRQFGRSYAPYKAQFGQRGLSGGGINSGSMKESMNRYVGDYGRQYLRNQQDVTSQLQQYDLGQENLDAWRSDALSNLESDKANEIAAAAANLQWLQETLGRL